MRVRLGIRNSIRPRPRVRLGMRVRLGIRNSIRPRLRVRPGVRVRVCVRPGLRVLGLRNCSRAGAFGASAEGF